MRVYRYDNTEIDQRDHHFSGHELSLGYLEALGITYHHCDEIAKVDQIAQSRLYHNRDEITISPAAMGEMYDTKVRMFFNEHLHEDEEIRYIMDGSGYFDVRDLQNEWIRIQLERHDLLILPAGIYHRFTTDKRDYIKAMRLFKEAPKWTPLNRAADLEQNPHRLQYMQDRNQQAGMMT